MHYQIQQIRENMIRACRRASRDPQQVSLVAISKTKPAAMIQEALKCGIHDIGENYAQEFLQKYELLREKPIRWHFVGHLQRRKVKTILGKVSLIHSVDNVELAQEIHSRAKAKHFIQPILLQVNIGQEDSKSGFLPKNIIGECQKLAELDGLKIQGLMCIPPQQDDDQLSRPYFQQMKQLLVDINSKDILISPMEHLSMGMSHDYEVAIEEGATLIRIGRDIFGERS